MSGSSSLLSMLFAQGLIRQPEVAITRSLAWLFGMSSRNPMARLIEEAGLDASAGGTWRAEVRAEDGTRTDLECSWGTPPRTRVVVEAKLGHSLTADQISTYIESLRARQPLVTDDFLMVLLVPAHRVAEARSVLLQLAGIAGPRAFTAVWTFDDVVDELSATLGPSGDLTQLRGLIEACEALDVRAFSEAELATRDRRREADLERILASASAAVSPIRVLPSRRGERDFTWMRYVEVRPGGPSLGVGLRRDSVDSSGPQAWASVRIHERTTNAARAKAALAAQFPGRTKTDPRGATWLALDVPTHVGGSSVHDHLVRQLTDILAALDSA